MPLALQARLLRVLDERMVTPLGTDETRPVDFQLISASHRNLAEHGGRGRFREDLYYRLAGIELQLPPLRERSDRRRDDPQRAGDEGGADAALTPAAWDLLMRTMAWQRPPTAPRAAQRAWRWPTGRRWRWSTSLAGGAGAGAAGTRRRAASAAAVARAGKERQALLELLEAQRWNVSHVAKSLDVSRNTLYRRMHKLRIPVTHTAERGARRGRGSPGR
jgi:transcriptional regulator of acetoin/glycerol metabolism